MDWIKLQSSDKPKEEKSLIKQPKNQLMVRNNNDYSQDYTGGHGHIRRHGHGHVGGRKLKKRFGLGLALLGGLAPDGGLYVPTEYPKLDETDLGNIASLSFQGLAFEVKIRLIGGSIPDEVLDTLIENAYSEDKFS